MWANDIVDLFKALEMVGINLYSLTANNIQPCFDGGIVCALSDGTNAKWVPSEHRICVYVPGDPSTKWLPKVILINTVVEWYE